jgi:hypothetical protein
MFELNSNNAEFIQRHIGPNHDDTQKMLSAIGLKSVEELISKTVPDNIRSKKTMEIPAGLTEFEMLQSLKKIGEKNIVATNFIGQGYYGTITPSVIHTLPSRNCTRPIRKFIELSNHDYRLNRYVHFKCFFIGRSDCCCGSNGHDFQSCK